MLILDANVLLHAYNSGSRWHNEARAWLEETLESGQRVGVPWITIFAFLRITTKPALAPKPLELSKAIALVRTWLEEPGVKIVVPGEQHADILFGLLQEVGLGGDLTTDAHLAALAIEYRAQLISTDGDFARFRGLRWLNPLHSR